MCLADIVEENWELSRISCFNPSAFCMRLWDLDGWETDYKVLTTDF